MERKKFYADKAHLLEGLMDHLEKRYTREGYEVQSFRSREADEQGYIFQARKRYGSDFESTASKLIGLDTAATTKIRQIKDSLDIEVGGGKWLDKAAVAGFAAFVAFPLLIVPAGLGAYNQYKLIEEISREIDIFLTLEKR